MLNKYDFKYILKRVITAIIISLILMFISSLKVNATSTDFHFYMNNVEIISSTYRYISNGNKSFRATYYTNSLETYYLVKMCMSTEKITGYYINSGMDQFNMYLANQSCRFPNSTYVSPTTVYITGKMNCSGINANCGNSANAIFDGRATFGTDDSFSVVLLDYVVDDNPIKFDTSGNNYDQQFNDIKNSINNQNTIINNGFNQQHQDSQNEQKKLEDINDSLTDTTPADTTEVGDWSSANAQNGVITNLLTLPIKLLNGYVSGINSSCSSFNLGSLYGTNLVLPCINVSNYIGSTLWGVIDVLFSGFMIFAISKKLVRIFNDFTNLRDHQIDELYGGGA